MLDCFSLIEKIGDLKGKNVALVGDILHSRVALSNIYALNLLGAKVMVCGPKSLIPKHIESLGVVVEKDLIKALRWSDAVNMLRVQNERMNFNYFPTAREYSQLYRLDRNKLNLINKQVTVLHPGPINRGVEISSEIADSKNAIILDQVENGVAVRMAIIYLLASNMNNDLE